MHALDKRLRHRYFMCLCVFLFAAFAFQAVYAGPADWQLVFSDDFEREELGEDWEVLSGHWMIENGRLTPCPWRYPAWRQIMVAREFPGRHRIEMDVESRYEATDMSPFIHAGTNGFRSGYTLQFGGSSNTRNLLLRKGEAVAEDREHLVQSGKVHRIVAEFDGEFVRLIVDGKTALEYEEDSPLLGEEHGRIGFWFTFCGYVDNVKIYTKPAGSSE